MIDEHNLTIHQTEVERAILVGVCTKDMQFEKAREYIDELAFLAETAGARTVRSFIQRLEHPIVSTYIGKGKVEEVKQAIHDSQADLVIFDDDLSPSQIRNLDKMLGVKVIDRSSLILSIFMQRAQSSQAQAQVDLANYQYLLPRLAGMWTHLSRQKGGIGLKGAGEKEIETDRRIIRQRISHLKKQLVKINRQDEQRRKNRSNYVRVALVGYTNVGKSTLMNILSKAAVEAADKLFATLDTTVRRTSLSGIPFLLSDTVGFIRKLPHHLIESFKSTLAEAKESDILIHVVDASHPQYESHIRNVEETLKGLDIQHRPILTVFNKVDCLEPAQRAAFEKSWMVSEHQPAVCISALERYNIDQLRKMLVDLLVREYTRKQHNGTPHPHLSQYQYVKMAEDLAAQQAKLEE